MSILDEILLDDGSLVLASVGTRDWETKSGNPWHDPRTGKFANSPPGVNVLRGLHVLELMPNSSKRLVEGRRQMTHPNAMTADITPEGNARIHFFTGSHIVDVFDVPMAEGKEAQAKAAAQHIAEKAPTAGHYAGLPDLVQRVNAPADMVAHYDNLRNNAALIQQKLENSNDPRMLIPAVRREAQAALEDAKAEMAGIRREQQRMAEHLDYVPRDQHELMQNVHVPDHSTLGEHTTSAIHDMAQGPDGWLGAPAHSDRMEQLVASIVNQYGTGEHQYNGKTRIAQMENPAQVGDAGWDGSIQLSPWVVSTAATMDNHLQQGQITHESFNKLATIFHEAKHQSITPDANVTVHYGYENSDPATLFLEEGLVEHAARHHLLESLDRQGVTVHGDPLSNIQESPHHYQEEFGWVQGVHHDLMRGYQDRYGLTSGQAHNAAMHYLNTVHMDVGHPMDRLKLLDSEFKKLGKDFTPHAHNVPGIGPHNKDQWTAPEPVKQGGLIPDKLDNLQRGTFSPKRFATDDHGHMWAMEHWGNDWLPRLTPEETNALTYWTTDQGYKDVNSFLRNQPLEGQQSLFEPQHMSIEELARQPLTDHQASLLNNAWQAPPPALGIHKGKGGAGGYTSDKAESTLTDLGREGERYFAQLTGGTIIHPEGKGEQSPLDVVFDGHGFEVKATTVNATDFKATPKPHEIASKEAFAAEHGITGNLAIVVIDREAGQAHVYYREGLKGGKLRESTGWKYMGTVNTRPQVQATDPFLGDSSAVQNVITHMDSALADGIVPEDVHAWRGGEIPREFVDNPAGMNGHVIRDPGFMATSLSKDTARMIAGYNDTSAVFRIDVPKGTRAGYVEPLRGLGENELLLPRGSALQVTGFAGRDELNRPILHARVVQEPGTVSEIAQVLDDTKNLQTGAKAVNFPQKFSQSWLQNNVADLTDQEYQSLIWKLQDRNWTQDEINTRVLPLRMAGLSKKLQAHGVSSKQIIPTKQDMPSIGDHIMTAEGKLQEVTAVPPEGKKLYGYYINTQTLDGKKGYVYFNQPVLSIPSEDIKKLQDAGLAPKTYLPGETAPVTDKGLMGKYVSFTDINGVHQVGQVTHIGENALTAKSADGGLHAVKGEVQVQQSPNGVIVNHNLGKELTFHSQGAGTTGAEWYTDANGNKWLVKKGDHTAAANQIASEILANKIYKELGVPVADMVRTQVDGHDAIAIREISHSGTLGEHGFDGISAKPLQDGFVADALVANWDVAGTGWDNILVGHDGTLYRVDHGGTFQFRAQGGHKDYPGVFPSEMDSLLQSEVNPYSAKIFDGLTDEQKLEQINKIEEAFPSPSKIVEMSNSAGFKDPQMAKEVQSAFTERVAALKKWAADTKEKIAQKELDKAATSTPNYPTKLAKDAALGEKIKWNNKDYIVDVAYNPNTGDIGVHDPNTGASQWIDGHAAVGSEKLTPHDELFGNNAPVPPTHEPSVVNAGSLKQGDQFELNGKPLTVKQVFPTQVMAEDINGKPFYVGLHEQVDKTGVAQVKAPDAVMPADMVQLHSDYQAGELPAGTIVHNTETDEYFKILGPGLDNKVPAWKVVEGDTGAWENPSVAQQKSMFLDATKTYTVYGLPGEADIQTGLNVTTKAPNLLQTGEVIIDHQHDEGPFFLVADKGNGYATFVSHTGGTYTIQSYNFPASYQVAENVNATQGPDGVVTFTEKGKVVSAPIAPGTPAHIQGQTSPEELFHNTGLLGAPPTDPDVIKAHNFDMLSQAENGFHKYIKIDVATNYPNLQAGMIDKLDHPTSETGPSYHVLVTDKNNKLHEIVHEGDTAAQALENWLKTDLQKMDQAAAGEAPAPEQPLPSAADLQKVGKVVKGNELKPGWKIQDVGYKEQGAVTVSSDTINGKHYFITAKGEHSLYGGALHTVEPNFHYKVLEVGPAPKVAEPKPPEAPKVPYKSGDIVKGHQLVPGTVIMSTHGNNHYTVESDGSGGMMMVPVDQGEAKLVNPQYDFQVISLPGGGEAQVTSTALSTLHLGDRVEIGGKEYIVAGVHGDTGVSLKDPLVEGPEGFKVLHHATQVTKLEQEPNMSVEGAGTAVQDALPAHYSYPPKVIQSWVKANVPQMTEKQYKNFVSHLLYNKNWNNDEIKSKIEPWKATAGVLKPAAAKVNTFIDPESGHKMFTSHSAGEGWAKSALDGLKNRVNVGLWDKVKNAFNGYFDGNYTSINSYLRGGKMGTGEKPSLESQIKAMDVGFAHANPSPEDIAIWRRADWPVPINQGKAIVGHYYRDKGFQSSSYMSDSWSGHLAKLLIPAGTPLVHANDAHMSDHPGEREILVGRGSIYKIVDVVYNGPDGKIPMMVIRWVGNENQGYVIPEGKKLYGTEGVIDRIMMLAEQLVHKAA